MILTNSGHKTLAEVMKTKTFYLGWGDLNGATPYGDSGNPIPVEVTSQTELTNEVGRVKSQANEFVDLAPSGQTGDFNVDGHTHTHIYIYICSYPPSSSSIFFLYLSFVIIVIIIIIFLFSFLLHRFFRLLFSSSSSSPSSTCP